MQVPFSPPDMGEAEIEAVSEVLRSGWITTGPKTAEFQDAISAYCQTEKTLCLNSATAGLELALKLFDIGPGDEVITSPYTFAATANIILHLGATPVFADVYEDDFTIDVDSVASLINEKTKAIIPVDFAGLPCRYTELMNLVKEKKELFQPKADTLQESLGRILVVADAAHSFGAKINQEPSAKLADFTVFSFHAVKNLTTAEGGAITFSGIEKLGADEIYQKLRLWSLHGQSKDAFAKQKIGGWHYNIEVPGYKYNMTDIQAAIGLVQLSRYPKMIERRKELFENYQKAFTKVDDFILPVDGDKERASCYHLYPLRLKNPEIRNVFINAMGKVGIACNVHFIPLQLQPLYQKMGYSENDTPQAYTNFQREVTLPLFSIMSDEQQNYVIEQAIKTIKKIEH